MFCLIKDCQSPHRAKGLCGKHYVSERRKDPAIRAVHQEKTRLWKLANPDKHAAQLARYALKNKDKLKAYLAQWKRDNWDQYSAYLAARKQRVKQATLKNEDLAAIEQFYFNCPDRYHVDHIIPLNGKNVCGLHTLINLQYLPALENLRKGNKAA